MSGRRRIGEFRTSRVKGEQQKRGQRKKGCVGRADTYSVMLALVGGKLDRNVESVEKMRNRAFLAC